MFLADDIFKNQEKDKRQMATFKNFPSISMDAVQLFKERLIEQYQNSPIFHTIVDKFHCSVQNGDMTFDALFGAVFLAKEIFIANQEDRICDDIKTKR